MRVRILYDTGCFIGKAPDNYCRMKLEILQAMFLPKTFQYEFVPEEEAADICIFSIFIQDTSVLRDNEINMLICIENVAWWWYPHYYHFNTYKDFGNEKVSIYYYNHYDKVVSNEQYLVIPVIYARLQYYESMKHSIS